MEEAKPDESGIEIGLLVPFTGSTSATASNLEEAAFFAADQINEAGGIEGQHVRIVSRDTHSDVARGIAAAKALANEGAVAVIGPENSEIATEIRPLLAAQNVLFLSPLVGAAEEPPRTCDQPWYRLAPSAKALGEALAKQAFAIDPNGVAGVLHTSTPYDSALGGAAAARFGTLAASIGAPGVVLEIELDPDAQSYASAVQRAQAAGVTDVILAMSPRAAAILVNEYDALSRQKPHWFLSPLLKTELLVQNVAPAVLEGAMGIAPKIDREDQDFPDAFAQRWQGDQPLEGAYFYYDAMALLALGLEKSTVTKDESLSKAVYDVSQTGEPVKWDGLAKGLKGLHRGGAFYYSGVTGPLSLEMCGGRLTGQTSQWKVSDGEIVELQ
jgi:ABC-type branched-subunit amino acid transport system substrate-binding protein